MYEIETSKSSIVLGCLSLGRRKCSGNGDNSESDLSEAIPPHQYLGKEEVIESTGPSESNTYVLINEALQVSTRFRGRVIWIETDHALMQTPDVNPTQPARIMKKEFFFFFLFFFWKHESTLYNA